MPLACSSICAQASIYQFHTESIINSIGVHWSISLKAECAINTYEKEKNNATSPIKMLYSDHHGKGNVIHKWIFFFPQKAKNTFRRKSKPTISPETTNVRVNASNPLT